MRFPKLPIEFYDTTVLKEIGSAIGPALRIDSYTASKSKGSYARLCIQVELDKPLIKSIQIGRLVQQVLYEGISTLCFCCGRMGHKQENCCYRIGPVTKEVEAPTSPKTVNSLDNIQSETNYRPWMVVTRKRSPIKNERGHGPTKVNTSPSFTSKGIVDFHDDTFRGKVGIPKTNSCHGEGASSDIPLSKISADAGVFKAHEKQVHMT